MVSSLYGLVDVAGRSAGKWSMTIVCASVCSCVRAEARTNGRHMTRLRHQWRRRVIRHVIIRLSIGDCLLTATWRRTGRVKKSYYIFGFNVYPTVEPNMKWVGWSIAKIWPFKIFQDSCQIGFRLTGSSTIRSADLENSTVDPNMRWIGWSIAEIWPFEIFHDARWIVGRCSSVGWSSIYTLMSWTPLCYLRNIVREE